MPISLDPSVVTPQLRGPAPSATAPETESRGVGFGERLADAVRATDQQQKQAEAATTALAEGRSDDLHGTMIALQRADVSLRLAANVRSRALEAYREVMRMGG
ncbi:MAG: flagellar hook-basal body complex protein FliE [Sandaracinus sp.]|nr:flagellar hook-basal body complex protein FliE [Sandaracinus sp.]MCB9632450.1 flagellar hook-basal body complex protein FliE [Sandaracinus sp.]